MSPGWGSLVGTGLLRGLILTQGGSLGSDQMIFFRFAVIHRLTLLMLPVIYR